VKDDACRPRDISAPLWAAMVREHEQNVVSELAGRLVQGSRKAGLKLTARECAILLAALSPKPKRKKGRPATDWNHTYQVAMTCIGFECTGMPKKAAVDATAKEFGISRSSVYAALRA
jgi:hypothetical protein